MTRFTITEQHIEQLRALRQLEPQSSKSLGKHSMHGLEVLGLVEGGFHGGWGLGTYGGMLRMWRLTDSGRAALRAYEAHEEWRRGLEAGIAKESESKDGHHE